MGTRALTVFKNKDDVEICVMYRQMDGYPEGHGLELAEFLNGFKMVNGLSDKKEKIANGMSCLVAQVIAHFKTEAGSFYIYPAGTRDCWEEYIYIVTGKEGFEPEIEILDGDGKFIGKMSASEYYKSLKQGDERQE
jgi:hypothetical protein